MDFGGHGLSSHYSSGVPYYHQTFVSEIRRVVAALKWNRFSILGHSFGGIVGGMFSCIFPEMVNKLILLDSPLLLLESNVRSGAFVRAVIREDLHPGQCSQPYLLW
uniref:AB hydrolase-1 domain-containing protein n=1 Tax=Macaca mulatta TaxID=9544 RepID=A0A5F7ZW18_MACMU